jgi:hypothetical protein
VPIPLHEKRSRVGSKGRVGGVERKGAAGVGVPEFYFIVEEERNEVDNFFRTGSRGN